MKKFLAWHNDNPGAVIVIAAALLSVLFLIAVIVSLQ